MKSMKEALQEADRDRVIDDIIKLIDEEVSSKRGLSGLALKGGYKTVKRLKRGKILRTAADNLLDDFIEALEPLHQEYREESDLDSFTKYLKKNDDRATSALLSITDERARKADHRVLKGTYNKLRPKAEGHVKDALPRVGSMVESYTDESEV